MALPNYVKFLRGTITAYNRLAVKDQDTLYFIYDANDSTVGTLYLGDRLIGGVGGEGGTNNLSELTDVLVNAASAGDFLVLNSSGKWINVPASSVAQTILDAGGNFIEIDENEFQFSPVDGKLELKGYSDATAGLIPVKSATGLSWLAQVPDFTTEVGDLQSALSQLQTDVSNLQAVDVDNKIATAIASSNHLKYEVINNLSSATATNVVYLYTNNRNEENNIYDEYMVINNSLEKIGQFGVDLNNYVTTTNFENALNNKADASDLQTLLTTVDGLEAVVSTIDLDDYVTTVTFNNTVGDLSLLENYNGITDASIADSLEDLYERLTWQTISE